jgi:hypothetical protein
MAKRSGTDVMIFEIFSTKIWRKNRHFCSNYCLFFCENLIITSFFEENANFFAENWRKSQKVVTITSTPVLKKWRFDFSMKNECAAAKVMQQNQLVNPLLRTPDLPDNTEDESFSDDSILSPQIILCD